MNKIRTLLTLALVAVITACGTTKTPDPCPNGTASNYPKELEPLVRKTCYSQIPQKKFAASAWAKNKNKWPYTTLVLYFYPEKTLIMKGNNNTSAFVHDVLKYCAQWEKYTNIRFYVTEDPTKADIKVSNKCQGYWSVIGKSAANSPNVTLNLDWDSNASETEKRRSGLHEIGHALGLEHEHLNPKADIVWDEEAVYSFYEQTQGWNREQTKRNVLEKYNGGNTTNNGFDENSIMAYPVSAELTKNNVEIGWNSELTRYDVDLINALYPEFVGKDGLTKKTLTNYKSRLIDTP